MHHRPMTRNARKIIEEARRLINRPRGWIKNNFSRPALTDDGHAYCLLGALNKAQRTTRASRTAGMDARHIIEGKVGFSIPYWNDTKVTGKRQVVAMLDEILKADDALREEAAK